MVEDIQTKKIGRKFKGVVVSAHGNKTIVVKIQRSKTHSKYLKRYQVTKKYKVHDEENRHQVGDEVRFVETRPLSKDKRWRVLYDQPSSKPTV